MYRFPSEKELERRQAWINAVNRKDWRPSTNSKLCCTHFITGKPSKVRDHPDWAPSRFAHKPINKEKEERSLKRYQRAKQRREVPRGSSIYLQNNSDTDTSSTAQNGSDRVAVSRSLLRSNVQPDCSSLTSITIKEENDLSFTTASSVQPDCSSLTSITIKEENDLSFTIASSEQPDCSSLTKEASVADCSEPVTEVTTRSSEAQTDLTNDMIQQLILINTRLETEIKQLKKECFVDWTRTLAERW